MSFTVEAVLGITFVLRAVLRVVRIKLQKEIISLRVLLYCMTQIISPRTISSSIEMPESGYNKMGSRPIPKWRIALDDAADATDGAVAADAGA